MQKQLTISRLRWCMHDTHRSLVDDTLFMLIRAHRSWLIVNIVTIYSYLCRRCRTTKGLLFLWRWLLIIKIINIILRSLLRCWDSWVSWLVPNGEISTRCRLRSIDWIRTLRHFILLFLFEAVTDHSLLCYQIMSFNLLFPFVTLKSLWMLIIYVFFLLF